MVAWACNISGSKSFIVSQLVSSHSSQCRALSLKLSNGLKPEDLKAISPVVKSPREVPSPCTFTGKSGTDQDTATIFDLLCNSPSRHTHLAPLGSSFLMPGEEKVYPDFSRLIHFPRSHLRLIFCCISTSWWFRLLFLCCHCLSLGCCFILFIITLILLVILL